MPAVRDKISGGTNPVFQNFGTPHYNFDKKSACVLKQNLYTAKGVNFF